MVVAVSGGNRVTKKFSLVSKAVSRATSTVRVWETCPAVKLRVFRTPNSPARKSSAVAAARFMKLAEPTVYEMAEAAAVSVRNTVNTAGVAVAVPEGLPSVKPPAPLTME